MTDHYVRTVSTVHPPTKEARRCRVEYNYNILRWLLFESFPSNMSNPSSLVIQVRSNAPDAAPDTVSITAAMLSETLCQTLFYGIYLATCVPCCRTICLVGTNGREKRRRHLNEVHWLMTVIALALLTISTFDLTIGWINIFHAFVRSDDAISVLTNFADWIETAQRPPHQGIDLIVSMLLWDFVLIYRCWIVYGRQWTVIIPSATIYLGNLALAGAVFAIVPSLGDTAEEESTARLLVRLTLGLYGTVALQNILTTGLLIWRIWRVEKESIQYINRGAPSLDRDHEQPRRLRGVIRALLESGAIYTTSVVVTLIASATQTDLFYPLSGITFQMTGIAFNMILIRTSPKRDQKFTAFDQEDPTAVHVSPHGHQWTEVVRGSSFNTHEMPKSQEIELKSTCSQSNLPDSTVSNDKSDTLTLA
ncbi:hypothetical protein NP233_g6807 [Leucocoprinus birnbaumii]|uniref:Uncharacterized protein n=1 Tax=Leucocoprinus birnbaumii TaxID=56174 RepID=A0AAD5VQC6_9AGAR|nr:hypothetical protein NP233_g6807 [Leucocoprinus birnbaumii]